MAKYLDQNGLAYFWSKIKAAIQAAPDTKNTAGATDTSSKIYIIGATSQGDNPQTYSQDTAYVGTDGHVYSNSKQVVNLSDTQAITGKTYNGLSLTKQNTGFTIAGGVTSAVLTVDKDYTLNNACAKDVDTSISAGSTSVKLPTSAAVASFVEGKGYSTTTGTVTGVTAGAGLNTTSNDSSSDGGTISTSGTLYLTKSGVTAGTYKSVTVDKYGRVTAGTNPTTISGYGITDAKIDNGVITLGSNTITPLTSSSSLNAANLTGAIPSAVTATTQSTSDNSTKIATTAFVTSAIAAAQVGAAMFQGTTDLTDDLTEASHWSFPTLTDYKKGWYWVVASDGTYAGQVCEAGDMIYCISNFHATYSASDFDVVQNNVVAITNAEIDTIVAS